MFKITDRMKRLFLSPLMLFAWTMVALAVPNVALAFTEDLPLLPALAQIVLPLALYALVFSLSRKTGKMVWWLFLFIFFGAFQIVLLFLFGNSIIGVDMFLNVLTTNPSEAFELLGNLLTGIATVVALYVPSLVGATMQLVKHREMPASFMKPLRRWALGGVAAGALFLGLGLWTLPSYRPLCDLYPLNVMYNVELTGERLYDAAHYDETSANFKFHAATTHPADSAEVYVLLLGETARADHFQLYGYNRPTTPRLLADTAQMVWVPDVLSESNTTHKSVPMLLTAASASDYNRIYRERGILTAFKEAGFHTAFFSNQRRNHSFIDALGEEADEVVFLKDDGAEHFDAELLGLTSKLLSAGHKRLFIVVHLYGSHFVYRERYQPSAAHFLPDEPTAARKANRPSLVNAYDNTILTADHVVDSLYRQTAATGARTALLYTSDHGENIYDDSRELFLHASPRPSCYDMMVPLLVFTSPAYRQAYPQAVAAMKRNRQQPVSSQASVFHTMLSLAGITSPSYVDSLSLASPAYSCKQRFYLNDHNEPVGLRNLKLTDEDFAVFRKRGIRY